MNSFSKTEFENGMIINNNKDTVLCKIKFSQYSENPTHCIARINNSITKYTTSEILEFRLEDGTTYRSIENSKTFSELISSGKVSLYRNGFNFYINKKGEDKYYLLEDKLIEVTKNGHNYTKKDLTWQRILNFLLRDHEESLTNLISKSRFELDDILEIVNVYNNKQIKEENKSQFDYKILVDLGMEYSNLTTSNRGGLRYLNRKYNFVNPTYGFLIRISDLTKNYSFSMETGLYYSNHKSETEKTNYWYQSDYPSTSITQLNMDKILIPFNILKFHELDFATMIYKIGLCGEFNINVDEEIETYEIRKTDLITIDELPQEFKYNSFQYGLNLGLGFEFKLLEQNFNLMFNYYAIRGFVENLTERLHDFRYSLNLAIELN
jgi:hypothetical protein